MLINFALNINNAKRVEECIIIKELIIDSFLELSDFKNIISSKYGYAVSDETIESCIINLNFKFIKKESSIVEFDSKLKLSQTFSRHLKNDLFKSFLIDNIEYSIYIYNKKFELKNHINGFQLYGKYTRKDVCRILNWEKNYDSTVYGYKIHRNEAPLFVTYRKGDDISLTTQYNDHFINQEEFAWESKAGRRLDSKDVMAIRDAITSGLRISLFIQKSNDEGADFYFMGNVDTVKGSLIQEYKFNDKNKEVPVVHMKFKLQNTVQESLYRYLVGEKQDEILDRVNSPENIISNGLVEVKNTPILKEVVSIIVENENENENENELNLIPFYDFYAAAGTFSEMQENKDFKMIEVPLQYSTDQKYFSCRVVGESMNRRIESNSICVFKEPLGGSRNGKIVLVENFGKSDEEYNSSFTIKTYASEKRASDDGEWEHSVILLKPNSTDSRFKDIVLHEDDCENMRVVGELVTVLKE